MYHCINIITSINGNTIMRIIKSIIIIITQSPLI